MEENKFIKCAKCQGDACAVTVLDDKNNKSFLCYSCGFSTTTFYIKGSDILKKADSVLPELYKDLLFTDDNNLVWYPSNVNEPERGMIFLDGTNPKDIRWAGILATDIGEDEKEKFPIPNQPGDFYNKKMDMDTIQYFDKLDFMSAAEFCGLFEPVEEVE